MVNEGYQNSDRQIIDYQLWPLPGTKLTVRGPTRLVLPTRYFVALGAAQTFGRFVETPYPTQLESALGIPVINLGFSGAGPSFFLQNPRLMEIINGAEFVIVQMMSGRSVSNSMFELGPNQGTLRKKFHEEHFPSERKFRFAEREYRELIAAGDAELLIRVRVENRYRYVTEMIELLRRIEPPKTLLYWSTRLPDYKEGIANIGEYWCGYPHFVNTEVIDCIKSFADHYVEVVTSRGIPQPLFNKETGAPVELWSKELFPHIEKRDHNYYYPSPEMHADVANKILAGADQLKRKLARLPKGLCPVIVHFHISRNGSSTVDDGLKRCLGSRWESWNSGSADQILTCTDLLQFLQNNQGLEAVTSHQLRAPLYGDEKYQFFPVVFLRHPVDRVASIYHFERIPARAAASRSPYTEMANALDFKEFVTWALSSPSGKHPVSNFQTLVLSRAQTLRKQGQWDVMVSSQDFFDASIFLTSLPVIGVVDQFEKSSNAFEEWLDPIFPGISFLGKNDNSVQHSDQMLQGNLQKIQIELGKPLFERLMAANQYDLALYQLAVRTLNKVSIKK